MVMLVLVDSTTVDFSAGVVVAVVGRRVLRDKSERGVDELSSSREAVVPTVVLVDSTTVDASVVVAIEEFSARVDLSTTSLGRNVVVVVKVILPVATIGVSDEG